MTRVIRSYRVTWFATGAQIDAVKAFRRWDSAVHWWAYLERNDNRARIWTRRRNGQPVEVTPPWPRRRVAHLMAKSNVAQAEAEELCAGAEQKAIANTGRRSVEDEE